MWRSYALLGEALFLLGLQLSSLQREVVNRCVLGEKSVYLGLGCITAGPKRALWVYCPQKKRNRDEIGRE